MFVISLSEAILLFDLCKKSPIPILLKNITYTIADDFLI
ncbi:Uncharacterised protein [Yersinia pekkanenii]|uniref:Uncharacterized protein n=1 Tax=Yersinia pekkanenii TaxID=1288385 RepID=A0A0T9Q8R2_9GAMM|nr:Uncharacterised protein [Yersinia pekkanenii]CRY63564.1 Uncharacterised protein [Yersinia pekkanenii]